MRPGSPLSRLPRTVTIGRMKRAPGFVAAGRAGWLSLLLATSGAACIAPPPRLPFQGERAHYGISVLGGDWTVNKDFGEDTQVVGLETVFVEPGTNGWGLEVGFRYAEGESDGTRETSGGAIVPSEREIQFYEFDLGVRQSYWLESRLQPYFGVGGALLQSRSEEHFIDSQGPPPDPKTDHERSEIFPGIYMRTGLVWRLLGSVTPGEEALPIGVDVRGLLSVDYSYLELSFSFGFAR